TEIKAASFETVDCGGKTNRWNETILQLWVPEDAEDTYMKSDKFLRIYDKVRRLVPVDEEAEIRIEYGDENFFPAPYHTSNWREEPEQPALARRKIDIDQRDAGLGQFKRRSSQRRDCLGKVGFVTDDHQTFSGIFFN